MIIAYLNHTTGYIHTVNDAAILADTRAIANLMMAMRQADGRHSRLVAVKNSRGEEVDVVTENVAEMERLVIKTQETEDAKNPDAARLAVIDGYANIGITPDQLAEYLGHPTDTMSAEEIRRLRGFGVALAEGAITWRDLLDARGGAGGEEADPEAAAKKAAKEAEVNKKVQATIDKKKAEAAAKKGAKAPEAAPTPKPEGKAPPEPAKPADGPTSGQHEPGTHDGAEPPPGWEPGQ
jgi:hypothetical protein